MFSKWVRLEILLVILISPCLANAYESSDHKQLTEDAAYVFNACSEILPEIFKKKLAYVDTMSNSNADIDKFQLLHLPRFLSRITNWHFYDAAFNYEDKEEGNIAASWLIVNRSLHKTFIKEVDALHRAMNCPDKEKIARRAGLVMHFIQDMSVPAHVAPNYHASNKPDSFEAYAHKQLGATKFLSASNGTCSQLSKTYKKIKPVGEKNVPILILEALANKTLEAIDAPIRKKDKAPKWDIFWLTQAKNKSDCGFFDYGQCGNKFGETVNLSVCELTCDEYKAFYKERYQQTIEASVLLLLYANP